MIYKFPPFRSLLLNLLLPPFFYSVIRPQIFTNSAELTSRGRESLQRFCELSRTHLIYWPGPSILTDRSFLNASPFFIDSNPLLTFVTINWDTLLASPFFKEDRISLWSLFEIAKS